MSVHLHPWEHTLISLAQEGISTHQPSTSVPAYQAEVLANAYAHCEAITAQHSRSFFLASRLLPPQKRLAARALYAFCRISDDIVDRGTEDVAETLAAWRQCALSARPPADDLVAVAWHDARTRFEIPRRYMEQLIEGVGQDLVQTRYQSFEDLAAYAYGVASTVGLMSMHIIGFRGPEAVPYAIKLGVALQMTNILRDVGEDWRAGRVYLPADELAQFGLSENDLANGVVTEHWRAFMRYQILRNRRLYAEAMPGIAMLHGDGRLAIAAAAEFYNRILDDIEAHDYDVFNRRAHVGAWGKLRRVPGLWWQTRFGRLSRVQNPITVSA